MRLEGGMPFHRPENPPNGPRIRPDFSKALEQKLAGWAGEPGEERSRLLAPVVAPMLDEKGALSLDKLSIQTREELAKLQKASEGIETIFVKKLLATMQQVSLDGQKHGPMAEFAKDQMTTSVAEKIASSSSSVGIAKLIFLNSGLSIIQAELAHVGPETPRHIQSTQFQTQATAPNGTAPIAGPIGLQGHTKND